MTCCDTERNAAGSRRIVRESVTYWRLANALAQGNDIDTHSEDLKLIEALDLKDTVLN